MSRTINLIDQAIASLASQRVPESDRVIALLQEAKETQAVIESNYAILREKIRKLNSGLF